MVPTIQSFASAKLELRTKCAKRQLRNIGLCTKNPGEKCALHNKLMTLKVKEENDFNLKFMILCLTKIFSCTTQHNLH